MSIETMLSSHPHYVEQDSKLAVCIDACYDCAAHCNACANACLGEDGIAALRHCIELNQTCAEICLLTGRFLSRLNVNDYALQDELVASCERACRLCAEECELHGAHHRHCRICGEACRRCIGACHTYARSRREAPQVEAAGQSGI